MLYSSQEAHAVKAAIETSWDPLKPGFYFLTRAAVLDLSATQWRWRWVRVRVRVRVRVNSSLILLF